MHIFIHPNNSHRLEAELIPLMHSLRKLLATSAALALLSLLLPAQVSAQQNIGFKISPTTIEDKVDPGMDRDFILKVQNVGQVPATLYPSAENITGVGPDQHPIYSTDKDPEGYELASWITYQETQLTLDPGESKTLHFTVHFPKDAHPGSHLAGVFLSDKPSDRLTTGASIGIQIGSILNFQVAGEIVEDTQIREFYTSKTVYASTPVPFTVRLENRGNVLSRPRGLIDVTNMFGRKVDSIAVNESNSGVFPKATKVFNVSWDPGDLQFGRYDAVVALAVEGTQGTVTLSRLVQFWVLPMNIIAPALGVLLLFILILYVLIRLYVKRQLAGVRMGRSKRESQGLSKLAASTIALLVAIIIGLAILFFYFG